MRAMPQSIPKGLTREHVLAAIAALDAGAEHPFGPPTGYELVHEGRRYPPKAAVGLACHWLLGRALSPEEFSGGEAPGQANYVLRQLGFVVEAKGASAAEADRRDWSPEEVALIVADYFAMLRAELAGELYNKAEHNRRLRPLLDGRSKSAVELKHQNISAVLVGMGLPYLAGYKPARNYQKSLLPHAIADHLARTPGLLEGLAEGRLLDPATGPAIGDGPVDGYFEARPDWVAAFTAGDERPWLSRRGRTLDFARLDAANRRLGQLGEEFVLGLERRRLLACGRDDLAAKVEWVARSCGDGTGFDVLSFDEADESEQFVEIKTTGLGKHFPFYVTATEVRCSEDRPEQFRLYRVFDFSKAPRVYVVGGPLSQSCRLDPVAYRASF
jgi:hypothetical protein